MQELSADAQEARLILHINNPGCRKQVSGIPQGVYPIDD